MEVTVEETGALERTITVRVAVEQVNAYLEKELAQLSATIKLPGFRPGKAPKKHLETRFKAHLSQTIMEQLMQEGMGKAIKEHGLRTVGNPELDLSAPAERDQPFGFTAKVQIMPDVQPQGYQGMTLTRPVAEVSDADIATALEQRRERHARYENREGRQATSGDQIVLNFKGFVDDEAFDGGTAEGYVLELGSGRFIPGFEDQLLGMSVGEERTVNVTFPQEYGAPNLAGKDAAFQCSLTEVRERVLPEIDDALAVSEGIKEGGLEALKERIRQDLDHRANSAMEKQLQRRIHDTLVAANPFDLPSKMVEREVEAMVEQFKEDTLSRGMTPDQHGLTDDVLAREFQATAEKRLRLGLVLGAIAKKEGLEVSDERVDAHLNKLAAAYGGRAAEFKRWAREDESRMDGIRGAVLEEMVNDWIKAHGAITDERVTLDALLAEKA
ncbi:MAG: trigger factor [Magnetococcales bacterium]|nr:trigger factor [Magnetococcales bacterium]